MTSDIRIGLIGGSGLGAVLANQTSGKAHNLMTPFGRPSSCIVETTWHGLPVFFLNRHGDGHLLNPSQVPYRANIFALKQLGVTHLLASGAVGSLREELKPRDIVVVDQIIDKTRRTGTFFDESAVHVEFSEPFCPLLRQILIEAGKSIDHGANQFSVHNSGCYLAMEGPAFSTRAESLMHRLWGADVVGMTAMPEAKLAREAEIAYALTSLVTDYDCWKNKPATDPAQKPDAGALLKEIIHHLEIATINGLKLLQKAVELIASSPDKVSNNPAHEALKFAIWSDKLRISQQEQERLAPLWAKYLD